MDQNHLLDDLTAEPIYASRLKRFLNMLIDIVVYYILMALFAIPLALVKPEYFEEDALGKSPVDGLEFNLIALVIYLLYYLLMEYFSGGRTIGKFITGTRVVTEDGSPLTFGMVFKRSVIRWIPFEPFSAFGDPCYPWHDKWSKTLVIDVKKSNIGNFS